MSAGPRADRRVRRRSAWIIAGGAALLLLAAGAFCLLLPRDESPEATALSYLNGLESGDLAAVASAGVTLSEEASTAFEQASERLSEPAVDSVERAGDTATVTVSFELSGERRTAELSLTQKGGGWVLDADSATGEVHIGSAPATSVQVGAAVIPVDEPIALLPAVYEFEAAPVTMLAGTGRVEALPGTTEEVDIDPTLRPEATAAAEEQLQAHLAACAEPAARVADHCGIRIPWAADLSSVDDIRYRIEKLPALTLSTTDFQAEGGILVATVTGTAPDGYERTVTYRTQDWRLRGDVTFTADDVVLSTW